MCDYDYAQVLRDASTLQQQGRFADSERLYREVLERNPQCAAAWHGLGMVAFGTRQHESAALLIVNAIRLQPEAKYYNNLGTVFHASNKTNEAILSFKEAISLNPALAESYFNLGVALEDTDHQGAIAAFKTALRLQPTLMAAYDNLAFAYVKEGQLQDAEAISRSALAIDPNNVGAMNDLGNTLQVFGDFKGAMMQYERAVTLSPTTARARFNRAALMLLQGDPSGWTDFDFRLQLERYRIESFGTPAWDGLPLHGGSLLIQAEQGIGDTLQFIRYVRSATDICPDCVVAVRPPLVTLLHESGIVSAVPKGAKLPPLAAHAPLMSLPRILRAQHTPSANVIPYLRVRECYCNKWSSELSLAGGIKVGISWQGNPRFSLDRFRSIALREFGPLCYIPGITFISLQRNEGEEQLGPFMDDHPGVDIRSITSSNELIDTAAIIMNLDLVITSDTAVAHLAGALGAPVWVALCSSPDWRWLLDRNDSPWYPSMRLFRQPTLGDWNSVFVAMATSLRSLAGYRDSELRSRLARAFE